MDGNGRWAKRQGLPRQAGHRRGAEVFRDIAEYCGSLHVPYLTVYAFSTENWKRPKEEIDGIMGLLKKFLDDLLADKSAQGKFRARFIGECKSLAPDIVRRIEQAEKSTANSTGPCVCIALNYGGRAEILHAVQEVASRAARGKLEPQDITEAYFSSLLDTAQIPDPDLIIRPSGEYRTSNFLLWQSAYAEYVFTDVLWPDFTRSHLDAALLEYSKRARRFGGV